LVVFLPGEMKKAGCNPPGPVDGLGFFMSGKADKKAL
jgi:hypothetical protein